MTLEECQDALQELLFGADAWHENTVAGLCGQMGVNRDMIRRWVVKGYVPPGSMSSLAEVLNLGTAEVRRLKQLYVEAQRRAAQQKVAGI